MPEKVFALMLYQQWDHNPSSIHCVMSSYELAKEALLSLDANAEFTSDTYGTCDIMDGWSGLDRWMIIECVIDLNPKSESDGNELFQSHADETYR